MSGVTTACLLYGVPALLSVVCLLGAADEEVDPIDWYLALACVPGLNILLAIACVLGLRAMFTWNSRLGRFIKKFELVWEDEQ